MKEIEIIFKQRVDNLLKILSKERHHNLLLINLNTHTL
jgi:hypothetical protein